MNQHLSIIDSYIKKEVFQHEEINFNVYSSGSNSSDVY